MCDWAYHHEALRKARVLERKHAVQKHQSTDQMDDANKRRLMEEKARQQSSMGDRNSSSYRRQCSGYERQLAQPRPVTCNPAPEIRFNHVEKHLRLQEKVLRNHNLTMGPLSAFNDYFDPRNYEADQDHRKYY